MKLLSLFTETDEGSRRNTEKTTKGGLVYETHSQL